MKVKIIALAVMAAVIYSCASKVPVAATPPAEPKTEVITTAAGEPKILVMTADMAAGKAAYENNCAKCHRLFEAKEYSKEDWAPILVRMQKKSHLTDAEMAPITNYIYTQL